MLNRVQPLSLDDFSKGLVTGADILDSKKNQSPNCLNVKWTFDDTLQKRLGSSTTNSVALQGTGGWAMFDFGATNLRWVTVSAGTGIYASSNGGTTFVVVATTRTQSYQYFERSKNVLIATSEAKDNTLFWAGSAGTFFEHLAINSAPSAKYCINYQGFLILLNVTNSAGTIRPRGFYYEDENSQLTGDWSDAFDLPSSADDEVTTAFILTKRLYVSTRYRIFRVTFVGGNPDWSYLQVKDWGFVPRTVRKITFKEGEVVVGMDWNRRIRVFDGSDDLIASDNIENDNSMSEFAIEKVSYSGSGLIVSHAEIDTNEQEYRLNVALGTGSTETTHGILLNGRTLAMYPYSNQLYQSMVMADSGGRQRLLACDRSGWVHILNSGNIDAGVTAINDVWDSPFIFSKVPGAVTKGQNISLYFTPSSSGTLTFQDRVELSSVYGEVKGRIPLVTTNSVTQIVFSQDIPSVQNIYQFRITSSSSTANPWEMTRVDLYGAALGFGKGGPSGQSR